MFKSKTRPVVIPQSEHAKLSGVVAFHWGNDDFDKPAIDFDSFIEGVSFHDWAYGAIDNFQIGNLDFDKWINLIEKGSELKFDNPVTDIVAKLHLKRLIDYDEFEGKENIVGKINSRINEILPKIGYTLDQFLWADRITAFFFFLAFSFSFEIETEKKVKVYRRINNVEETELIMFFSSRGEVKVDPWPFSVNEIKGFIYAYDSEGYPDVFKPTLKKYFIRKI